MLEEGRTHGNRNKSIVLTTYQNHLPLGNSSLSDMVHSFLVLPWWGLCEVNGLLCRQSLDLKSDDHLHLLSHQLNLTHQKNYCRKCYLFFITEDILFLFYCQLYHGGISRLPKTSKAIGCGMWSNTCWKWFSNECSHNGRLVDLHSLVNLYAAFSQGYACIHQGESAVSWV